MKIFIIILNVFLFCCGCFSQSIKYQISDREKAVNKQMAYSGQMLSKKYSMRLCATTVAMPGGNIQYLELKFDIRGPLSKMAIRKLLIDIVNDFLLNINNDVALCSYLKDGRLEISEIGITLFLHDLTNRPIAQPEIGVAFIEKGILTFITLEPESIPSFRDQIEESYEDALLILDRESKVSPLSPSTHCTPKHQPLQA